MQLFQLVRLCSIIRTSIQENGLCIESESKCVVRNRERRFDIAKGIGIFLVVLGHMPNFLPNSLLVWIKGFHMPLFFFISGYFAKPESSIQKLGNRLKQKIAKILFPYICFSIVFAGIEYIAMGIDSKVFKEHMVSLANGSGGYYMLWFLFCLFTVECMFYIVTYICRIEKIRALLILGCVFTAVLLKYKFYYNGYKIGTSLYAVGFFYLGYLWKKKQLLNRTTSIGWNVVFIMINIVGTIYMILNGFAMELVDNRMYDIVLNYAVAISAIIVILNISQWLLRYRVSYILEYIGTNSLYFYPLTGYIPDLAKIVFGDMRSVKIISRIFSFIFTYGFIETKEAIKEKWL